MNHGSIRLFVESDLGEGAEAPATSLQAHYLGAVMRRSVGDPIILFNGRDGEWLAHIVVLRRDRATLRALSLIRPQAVERELALIFAPLKRDATDLVVQKATELGATAIHPVLTAHSNTQRVNLDRFRSIAIEAAEQCERLDLPTLHTPVPLQQFLDGWPAAKPVAACFERSGAAAIQARAAGLIVGPEGGFTLTELDVMRRHSFLIPVSLGPRVLRAETAAIAGLALLQSY